jgi:oleate hydratase
MNETHGQNNASQPEVSAWILGSGTASLASAVYLVQRANLLPQNVHILDSHTSMGATLHHSGDAIQGYDQFAGCLPVPVGVPLQELLASIPSGKSPGSTVLDEIRKNEANHIPANRYCRTKFFLQNFESRKLIPLKGLGLSVKCRIKLALLMLKSEKSLERIHIKDFMPKSFFQSNFWMIWTSQFGFQPRHSAIEFRRALRQYLREFHHLNILNCLDITGYYQYESVYLPIYLYLRNLGVDFHFDTKVRDIDTTTMRDGRKKISRLNLLENGYQVALDMGEHDIVILMLGSTVSGSSTGTHNYPPPTRSIELNEEYDENWTIWLELITHGHTFGNPYNFCTRVDDSTLTSFTITTADTCFWEFLASIATHAEAGAFVLLPKSNWDLRLCIPMQPVFGQQPENIHVIWGFALFPKASGNYVQKSMEACSGAQVITEILGHLNYHSTVDDTTTIPRHMPRMSSLLLVRSIADRPEVIPPKTSHLALVGQFVEIPWYSCVDMSYGIRTAQIATSQLTGIPLLDDKHGHTGSTTRSTLRVLFWK